MNGKSLASEPFIHLPHFPRAFQSDVERVQVLAMIFPSSYSSETLPPPVHMQQLKQNGLPLWVCGAIDLIRCDPMFSHHYRPRVIP